MNSDPLLGILLHGLGGLGAASFYVFFTRVRGWAWETYWLVGGVVLWIVCPWLVAIAVVPELWQLLGEISSREYATAIILGVGWGVGNLTFGLSIRYLGFAGGYSIALGLIIVFGALVPPLVKSAAPSLLPALDSQKTLAELYNTLPGRITLAGIPLLVLGVLVCALAGGRKEKEQQSKSHTDQGNEFHLAKGLWIALTCGIMSACLNLAITDTDPIAALARNQGAAEWWANSVTIAIVLTAGGLTNIAWCLALNLLHGTIADYFRVETPLAGNYCLCLLAGVVAYSEFLFYGLAAPLMGAFSFINLPIHVALCVVLGSLWGTAFGEWKGTSARTRILVLSGILILLAGVAIIGYGSALSSSKIDYDLVSINYDLAFSSRVRKKF